MRNEYDFIAGVTNRFRALEILVGCEESQEVTKALREIGHNAKSCDIQECSGAMPEHHYQMDVFEAIRMQKWDIIILHPPCTKIAVSGNRWYGMGQPRHQERIEAVEWTLPSLLRIFLSTPTIAEFDPVDAEDEEQARQGGR